MGMAGRIWVFVVRESQRCPETDSVAASTGRDSADLHSELTCLLWTARLVRVGGWRWRVGLRRVGSSQGMCWGMAATGRDEGKKKNRKKTYEVFLEVSRAYGARDLCAPRGRRTDLGADLDRWACVSYQALLHMVCEVGWQRLRGRAVSKVCASGSFETFRRARGRSSTGWLNRRQST